MAPDSDLPAPAETARRVAPTKPDRRLLELLVCPITRGPLEFVADQRLLISRSAGVAFPIRDGIAILIPEEAIALDTLSGTSRPPR